MTEEAQKVRLLHILQTENDPTAEQVEALVGGRDRLCFTVMEGDLRRADTALKHQAVIFPAPESKFRMKDEGTVWMMWGTLILDGGDPLTGWCYYDTDKDKCRQEAATDGYGCRSGWIQPT